MHLSMSCPRAGHIGDWVRICTTIVSSPHPLGLFVDHNPLSTSWQTWDRTLLNFLFVAQRSSFFPPLNVIAILWLPDKAHQHHLLHVLNYMADTHAHMQRILQSVLITIQYPLGAVSGTNTKNPPVNPAQGVVGRNIDSMSSAWHLRQVPQIIKH